MTARCPLGLTDWERDFEPSTNPLPDPELEPVPRLLTLDDHDLVGFLLRKIPTEESTKLGTI